MSDVEKVDVKLGRFSRNNEGNDQSENELNLDSESSRSQRNSNLTSEDCRLLLANSRENSEITIIETTRLINEEISNQMSRRLIEIKTSLDSQIQNAITTAITETEFPSIQNTLDMQGTANFTVVDRESGGLHVGPRVSIFTVEDRRSSVLKRNPEAEKAQKTWENCPKKCFMQKNSRQMSRETSVDSFTSEQNRDISLRQNLFGIHQMGTLGCPLVYFHSRRTLGLSDREKLSFFIWLLTNDINISLVERLSMLNFPAESVQICEPFPREDL